MSDVRTPLALCVLVLSSGPPAGGSDGVARGGASTDSSGLSTMESADRIVDVRTQEAVFATVLNPKERSARQAVARELADASDRTLSWVQERLRILRHASGTGMYVQVDDHLGPVDVVFRPTAGGAATLLRGVERSPSMRVERDERDRSVVLFRIGQSDTSRYEFSVPSYIESATVVVNGQLVAESHGLSTEKATSVRTTVK